MRLKKTIIGKYQFNLVWYDVIGNLANTNVIPCVVHMQGWWGSGEIAYSSPGTPCVVGTRHSELNQKRRRTEDVLNLWKKGMVMSESIEGSYSEVFTFFVMMTKYRYL
jgi:hypothetical protein